jgi:hypothetical protein
MKAFIESLPDGWTIYVWMVAAAGILIAAVFGLRWAARNKQFDEDIKYVVFDENDKDKMSPEEFAKSREVLLEQERQRDEFLENKAKQRAAKHARR